MTLAPHEFIRRFLMHVLPKGFHRIRHYGLFANGNRAANIARARELLGAAPPVVEPEEQTAAASDEPRVLPCPCPRCGGRMIVIEVFARGCEPNVPDRRRSGSTRHDRSLVPRRKAARLGRRSLAGDDPLRPLRLIPGSQQPPSNGSTPFADVQHTPSAFPPVGPRQLLLPESTILTTPAAPKSP